MFKSSIAIYCGCFLTKSETNLRIWLIRIFASVRYINLICLSNLIMFFVLLCLLHLFIRYFLETLRCSRFRRLFKIRTRRNVFMFGTVVPSETVANVLIPKSTPTPSEYSGKSVTWVSISSV